MFQTRSGVKCQCVTPPEKMCCNKKKKEINVDLNCGPQITVDHILDTNLIWWISCVPDIAFMQCANNEHAHTCPSVRSQGAAERNMNNKLSERVFVLCREKRRRDRKKTTRPFELSRANAFVWLSVASGRTTEEANAWAECSHVTTWRANVEAFSQFNWKHNTPA